MVRLMLIGVLILLCSGCGYHAENRITVNGKNVEVEMIKWPPTIKGEDVEVDIIRDSWWQIFDWRFDDED